MMPAVVRLAGRSLPELEIVGNRVGSLPAAVGEVWNLHV